MDSTPTDAQPEIFNLTVLLRLRYHPMFSRDLAALTLARREVDYQIASIRLRLFNGIRCDGELTDLLRILGESR